MNNGHYSLSGTAQSHMCRSSDELLHHNVCPSQPRGRILMLAIIPTSFRLLLQGLSCGLFCFLFTFIGSKGPRGLIKSSMASESKTHYLFGLCLCALEFLKELQCRVDFTSALSWLLSSEVSYTFLLITAPQQSALSER